MGAAIKGDEYVPKNIPIRRDIENQRVALPPSITKEAKTKMVVIEVFAERTMVRVSAAFIFSSKPL